METSDALIIQYLRQQNLKMCNKGFWYCVAALKIADGNPENITKIDLVYDEIGIKCNENKTNIARAIRYSLLPLGIANKEFLVKAVCELGFIDAFSIIKARTSGDSTAEICLSN